MSNTERNNQGFGGETIERLRLILERKQSRSVTLDEATEVGEGLLSFFQILGEQPGLDSSEEQTELALGVTYEQQL
jgi:hypothetical protein